MQALGAQREDHDVGGDRERRERTGVVASRSLGTPGHGTPQRATSPSLRHAPRIASCRVDTNPCCRYCPSDTKVGFGGSSPRPARWTVRETPLARCSKPQLAPPTPAPGSRPGRCRAPSALRTGPAAGAPDPSGVPSQAPLVGAVSAHPRRSSPRAFAPGSSRPPPTAADLSLPGPPDLDPDLNDTSPEPEPRPSAPCPSATTPSDSHATSPLESPSPMNDADRELIHRGLLPAGPAPAATALASSPAPAVDRLEGALLGAACGSALGRQVKGMRPEGIRQRFGWLADLEQVTGSGACPQTDDSRTLSLTLQACMAGEDSAAQAFGERLVAQARALQHLGRSSSEAIRRLSEGRRWWRAGTPSAGNGAALRTAAVGLAFGNDLERLRLEAARNAVVTHADRLAAASAIVMAHATALLVRTPQGTLDAATFIDELVAGLGDLDDASGKDRRSRSRKTRVRLADRLREVVSLLGRSPEEAFAVTQNGAYVLETLPAALWCFLQHPEDPELAILTAVHGGFDADSVASLTGALAGAYCGAKEIPARWSERLAGSREFGRVARRLAAASGGEPAGQPEAGSERADRVHVTVLLDRSGSMGSIREDTIGGFNAFLEDQRKLPGECRVSLVQFDTADPQEVTVDAVPVAEAPALTPETYCPRGGRPARRPGHAARAPRPARGRGPGRAAAGGGADRRARERELPVQRLSDPRDGREPQGCRLGVRLPRCEHRRVRGGGLPRPRPRFRRRVGALAPGRPQVVRNDGRVRGGVPRDGPRAAR